MNYKFFVDFETAGTEHLNDFPFSKSLPEIWDVINKSSVSCLEILLKYNVIDKEIFEDYKMHLRVALKYEVRSLVPTIDVTHFYNVRLGEDNLREKMKEFQNSFLEFKQGLHFYYYRNILDKAILDRHYF